MKDVDDGCVNARGANHEFALATESRVAECRSPSAERTSAGTRRRQLDHAHRVSARRCNTGTAELLLARLPTDPSPLAEAVYMDVGVAASTGAASTGATDGLRIEDSRRAPCPSSVWPTPSEASSG